MNHTQNYITQQTETCRKEWFSSHKANHIKAADCELINWQNPKSWNYGCRFIIHRRWLCVVGDIGEATFEWSEDLTLEFLAQIDFGYFLSKCRASPEGRKFEQWDGKIAWLQLCDYVAELCRKLKSDQSETHDAEMKFLNDLTNHSEEYDYQTAARAIYDATGDAETAGMIHEWGKVPSVHAIGMFVGLQMAITQLKGTA